MRYPDLEIDLLRAFVTVADSGGFTSASDLLGRTQSAVSQKIKRLEDILAKRLFERTSRSLALTRDGEVLLAYARRLLDLNDETIRRLVELPVSGKLRLGVAEDFIAHQVPALLNRFAADCPHIEIEMQTGLSCALLRAYDAGDVDLVIARRDGRANRGRVIWHEPLIWAGRGEVELPAGRPVPLVVLPPPCAYRTVAIETLQAAGRQWTITCTGHSLGSVMAAVSGGLGLTVVGRSFLPGDLVDCSDRFTLPALPMTEVALVGEDTARSDLAAPLVAFLLDALRGGV
jgi:DNA-binding transcriptional LysR family regulator